MNDGSRVLVAVRVRVSPERAFVAFTEQIAQWWRPHGLFQFTPGRVGTMVLEPGPDGRLLERYDDGTEFVVGHVRSWEPPHRVVLGWRHAAFAAEEDTELQVSFDEVTDGQTRVTVEHVGWDRIPPENAARHGFPLEVLQLRLAEWWQSQLRAVAASLRPRE